ncbi:MAG: TetR/AcrR family transcriptional regulator [Gemmatimonadota bacterium]
MSTRKERIRVASQKRRSEARESTRQLILDAAEELFVERGYADLSLREVAERIGYSPAAIYRYFEHKDHLVATLNEEGFARFTAALQAAFDAHDDPVERLEGLHRTYLRFAAENPVHYRLMFMERLDFLERDSKDFENDPPEALMILYRAVGEAMERGMVEGPSVREVGDALWAAVHGAAALTTCLESLPEEWKHSVGEGVLDLVMRGLGVDR